MTERNILPEPISGIILSGGYSNRFQQSGTLWQDKALQPFYNNETLLEHTIKVLTSFCSEILVMTSNYTQQLQYMQILTNLPKETQNITRIEIDDMNVLCSGPSRGLLSAFNFVSNQLAVVSPIDTPFVYSSIFIDLLNNLGDSSISVPIWSTGKIEPLICAVNVQKIQTIVPFLAFNERSRADDILRLAQSITFLPINPKYNELAEQVFKSINNKQEFDQFKHFSLKENYDLFNTNSIKIVEQLLSNELYDKLTVFFNLTNFQKISNQKIIEGMELSQKLHKNQSNYFAGFLLTFLLRLIKSNGEISSKLINEIIIRCKKLFVLEAEKWEKYNVNFLALHAYLDAFSVIKSSQANQDKKNLQSIISKLRKEMLLKEKEHRKYSFTKLFKDKLPNFINNAKELIRKSEAAYNEQEPKYNTDFLWDHSYRVGQIAYYLAVHEGIDPLIPTLAAILHDAGKFVLGQYHSDDIIEEVHSASIAENILSKEGISKQKIALVKKALLGLYSDKIDCNTNCQIVSDADRLEKLGVFGIANYFTKMTLRGYNLSSGIERSLSRELTYASSAPLTMQTKTGQLLATKRATQTIQFFKDLLLEMEFYNLGKYFIKEFNIDKQTVLLVIPKKCEMCSGKYGITLSTKTGLKCEKLVAIYHCLSCNNNFTIEFCLPLISNK
jgi:molybdopterin-guanine dinucleotide biosynthesis protein A/HD superfamily phosphodiesterase